MGVDRQQAMAGLAMFEIAQTVKKHWDSLQEGGVGVLVPNTSSSEALGADGAIR